MTLIELPEIEQGTAAWFDQRRGLVTASVVGKLITPSTLKPAQNDTARALLATLVAERITGYTEPSFTTDDMQRGHANEIRARDLYSELYAPVTETGFLVRDDWGFSIGFSPDGMVGTDGLIEVKSPRAKGHLLTIVGGSVPAYHMAQIQCGLLVSGRSWCDFLSYSSGMPMWRQRVMPDPDWFDAIVVAVEQFEKAAAGMVRTYRDSIVGLPETERPIELEMVI